MHLNWGDAGLLRLFQRCCEALAPGGVLLLEPQPWKSYQQALRKQVVRALPPRAGALLRTCVTRSGAAQMPQEVQDNFRAIKLRPDGFAAALHDAGFAAVEELREGGHRGFDRPLLLCTKAGP